MADVQIKGVYTDVDVRDMASGRPGCVYILTFRSDLGERAKVFVPVASESPAPLRPLALLLASTGAEEPKEGWASLLCTKLARTEWKFSREICLRVIQDRVLGKRTTVVRDDSEHGASYTPGPAFGFDNVIPFPSRA